MLPSARSAIVSGGPVVFYAVRGDKAERRAVAVLVVARLEACFMVGTMCFN